MFRIVPRLLALAVFIVPAAAFAGTAQARAAADAYTVNPLVSDSSATPAAATDRSLVNAWGLSVGPTTPWWVSDNGTNLSTLYSGTGAKTPLTVSVPGGPTGTVFNGSSSDFVGSQGAASGASRFLFATEGGTILGWTQSVNGTVAIVGADRSNVGAVYKASRPRTTASTPPTSTMGASTSSIRRSSWSRRRAPSRTPRSPRGSRRSGSRRSATTSS